MAWTEDAFPNGDAFVGIGIGERDFWGKGYGTDAMKRDPALCLPGAKPEKSELEHL